MLMLVGTRKQDRCSGRLLTQALDQPVHGAVLLDIRGDDRSARRDAKVIGIALRPEFDAGAEPFEILRDAEFGAPGDDDEPPDSGLRTDGPLGVASRRFGDSERLGARSSMSRRDGFSSRTLEAPKRR